jgi:hypothetical protein
MIVVSDGTHCLIPHWMLDAAACSTVSDEVSPRISVDALRALRDLLDAQTLSFQLTPDSRGTSSINGGSNDVETTDRQAVVDVSLGRGPRRVEPPAQYATGPVSRTVGSTAASSCGRKRNKNRKEQQR